MDKHFIFRHYWWIAILGAVIAIALIVTTMPSGKESLFVSVLGAAAGFCYFVQKQKVEELRLFKDLFSEFNRRYDELNDRLVDIRTWNVTDETARRKTLVDYFNLCAEEFLFFAISAQKSFSSST